MKIGIDASAMLVARKNGYEVYATQLISAISQLPPPELTGLEIFLYFYAGNRFADPSLLQQVLPQFSYFHTRVYRLRRGYEIALPLLCWLDRLDWLHLPVHIFGRRFPCPVLSTFHDACVTRLGEDALTWDGARGVEAMISKQLAISDRFIAVSQSTRNDMIAFYGVSPQLINTVPHGVDPRFRFDGQEARRIREFYNLPQYILSVNALQANKNYPRLLESFALLRKERHLTQVLVIVGREGWGSQEILNKLNSLDLGDSVRILGFVPAEHLVGLYSGADLVVNPSLCEGFGLTILEALACDAIVAASNSTSLPEVGGQAVGYFDPNNVLSIADVIFRLLTEEKERIQLREYSQEQLDKFTWQKAAKDTLDVYRSLI